MENILPEPYENGQQAFFLRNGDEKLAEMVIKITGKILTVYHTEVYPKAEGKGAGKLLLKTMVNYAREHGLKVIPLCIFVLAQFRRHPELYADVWQKQQD